MRYFNSIANSCLGNLLEWYDFGLFTIFSSLFSELFFPLEAPMVARIATFGIFAVGFFCRPLGALLFGYYGDKMGRARTLRLSLLLVLIPSLLIGILPTYASIGIAAPILLVIIRILQGISIGGEYSGNMIYLAEVAPSQHRALFVALASSGSNMGILLAMLIGWLTTNCFIDSIMHAWGWRIPYLASGIICLLIYQFRMRLQETHVFYTLQKSQQLSRNPITAVFKYDFTKLTKAVGLVCMGTTFYFFCFVYVPLFLKDQYHYSLHNISALMTVAMLIMIFLAPVAGMLCDKVGRRKMLLFNAVLITCSVVPGFYMLHLDSAYALFATMILFTIASAFEQGTTPIALIENFPARTRYTGVSLGYNIGNGILGGTVPVMCGWLLTMTHLSIAPALYIALCGFITLCVVYFFIPNHRLISV